MSQQELEQTDREVMNVVNPHATPEASANAERLGKRWEQLQEQPENENDFEPFDQQVRRNMREVLKKDRCRKQWTFTVSLALCMIVAGLLLFAMYVPAAVVWIANVGILICGIVAAVIADRYWGRR